MHQAVVACRPCSSSRFRHRYSPGSQPVCAPTALMCPKQYGLDEARMHYRVLRARTLHALRCRKAAARFGASSRDPPLKSRLTWPPPEHGRSGLATTDFARAPARPAIPTAGERPRCAAPALSQAFRTPPADAPAPQRIPLIAGAAHLASSVTGRRSRSFSRQVRCPPFIFRT
jgi:hypothetical protein